AEALHLSPKTVANGHYEIKRKIGVKSDIELVHLALRLQVIDLLEVVENTAL
ncbi:MAG: LuxR C-terminal-related transcriptional regulator, partial [Gammaproteobacteria bacterium]